MKSFAPVAVLVSLSAMMAACSPAPQRTDDPTLVEAAPAPAPPPSIPKPALPSQASDDWKVYARPTDVTRLARLDAAWDAALARARAEGAEAALDELGALAKRGGGLDVPFAAPGAYRCRTIQVGGESGGLAVGEFAKCQVELTPGGDLVLRTLDGAARFEGKLYPERPTRLVYLGAAAPAAAYGEVPASDQIGAFERVGDDRYRLTLVPAQPAAGLQLVEVVK